jgi:hypothetical protein
MGRSGATGGLGLLGSAEKSMDQLYANPQPPVVYSGRLPVHKHYGFTAGLTAKRSMGKRIHLATGLEYNFLSTRTQVGYRVSRGFLGAFNPNTAMADPAANKSRDYYNYFHFVSLPVQLEWQPVKKFPLHVHGGLVWQQLVHTNGLSFDPNTLVYTDNKDAFNRTQIFTALGMDYAVLNKKHSLVIGPELKYGLTAMEKNSGDQHLFSIGIRAQFLLKK